MGKMDGLLRRVRRLELRVKYCQHLHKTRKLSITHWKGEENPSDGLTKSLRPLSLWTNLVEALVPGPTSNWIRNYLNLIQQRIIWIPSGPAIRGIREGDKQVNFGEFQDLLALLLLRGIEGEQFQDLLALPFMGIQEGKSSFTVHDIIIFLFSFVSSFILS